MMQRSYWQAYFALGLGILGLGFSGLFVKWANAPGAVTGFYRMGIATAVLAIPFFRRLQTIEAISYREIGIALAAGALFAGDLIFWNSGVLISGATTPTLMGNTSPIWVGLGALIFFHERLNRTFWVGLAVALAGTVIIVGLDALNNVGLGTFYGLLAGMFYGAYFLVTQRNRQKLDALTSFWLAAAGSTLMLLLAALALRQPITGYSTTTYLNFLGLGLIVQAFGQLAINYALGYIPASIVSPTLLAQPILTAVLAVPLLGENLSALQIMGGLAVIIGVFIIHHSRRQKPIN